MPDLVEDAIRHFGLRVAEIAPVADSYSSTVRILTLAGGQRVVLKIPWVSRKLVREVRALRALQADMPVPEVLDVWEPEATAPGALLLSYLPGTPIGDAMTPDLARQMGVLLGRLHTHRLAEFGDVFDPVEPTVDGWWALMRRRFELWKPLCEGVLPADVYQGAAACYCALDAALPAPDGPCWTHHDYRPGNVLIEEAGTPDARIVGLIDFESTRGGSADLDFVKASHRVWDVIPGTREAFLAGYATVRPVPAIERTLPLYRLHHAFGGIAWCVRRTDTDDPFFRENLEMLVEVIEDVEGGL